MAVHVLKLVTGEEVIGQLVSENPLTEGSQPFYLVSNPVTLSAYQDPTTGQVSRGFADWPALARPEQEVRIYQASLLCNPLLVIEDLERKYVSAITGMELPPAEKKILLS